MSESRHLLRLVESGPRSVVLHNPRVLRDFTRVCRQMRILDPDTGLIRAPLRDRLEPAR